MAFGGPDPREAGRYFALAQTGLEMVVPIGVGLAIDHYAGCSPWGAAAGAILGLFGGLAHLVVMVNRQDTKKETTPFRNHRRE